MRDAPLQDLRYAVRHLTRAPGFTAAAIITLAFAIGANAAMFSLLNGLVLRPLAIPDPDGLIGVAGHAPNGERRLTIITAVEALRERGPLEHVCGYNGGVVLGMDVGGSPTVATGALVTGRCLSAFGIRPILGCDLDDDEAPIDRPGQPVAMISHGFWTRMFGADPCVIGRMIVLRMVMADGLALTAAGIVIGVPAAIVAGRGLRTLFFGVTEADPWTLGAAVVFFAGLGAAAGLVPARRAASTDPATVLRND